MRNNSIDGAALDAGVPLRDVQEAEPPGKHLTAHKQCSAGGPFRADHRLRKKAPARKERRR